MVVTECGSARVTPSAIVDLCLVGQWGDAVRDIVLGRSSPLASSGSESASPISAGLWLRSTFPAVASSTWRDPSVARLAANINLIIGRRVLPALAVVALYDIGAVALCTPAIPVVVDAGPVQRAF